MNLTTKQTFATHRVCVYGPPKSGKTELVGKLAKHFNLIWFDAEKGWTTLLKMPEEMQANINIISVPDSKTFPICVETWLKVIQGKKVDICEEHGKVACALCKKDGKHREEIELASTPADTIIVFDSLTQYTQSAIANITKSQPDDYKLQHDDWGNLKVLVEKFLSQVQAANYNIVCITHEEEVEMEDGRKKIVPVCGSSKSSRNTAKYFDHVIYCEVKNKKHVAGSSTIYSNSMITGSRTDVEMEKSTEPSLLDIFTGWKNRDGGSHVRSNIESSNNSVGDSSSVDGSDGSNGTDDGNGDNNVTVLTPPKTPGQLALERLQQKKL